MSTGIVWQKEWFTACSCAMSRVIHQDVVIEAAVHASAGMHALMHACLPIVNTSFSWVCPD